MPVYLIDTNVASTLDPRKSASAAILAAWIRRNELRLFMSPITLLELETGRLKLVRGERWQRAAEIQAFVDLVRERFQQRILPISAEIALAAAEIAELSRAAVTDIKDILIAATARVHGLTVLTRNLRHFRPTGVPAIDPFERLPPDA